MKKILLLLAEGFELLEASVYIDVIGWNLIDGDGQTELFTCGIRKEIISSFNQRFIVDYTADEICIDNFTALAIPGGFAEYNFYIDAYSDEFIRIINGFYDQGKLISSICTGAFPIAKSGILNGKLGTTYNMNPVRHETLSAMGVNVVNQPIATDGKITTSWNPSTAIDVAFLLLEDLTSKEQVEKIKILMGFI